MIDYNPKNWARLIFRIHKSEQFRYLAPFLIFMGLYTWGILYLFKTHIIDIAIPSNVSVHGLLGIVLGLVLVFRTNTAYSRWWEGRTLWGGLINHCRNMAIKLHAGLDTRDRDTRRFFAVTISNFSIAVKENLRSGVHVNMLNLKDMPYAKRLEDCNHIPNELALALSERVTDLFKTGAIQGETYREIMREVNGLIDTMGGCERIRKTPIAYSYISYIKRVIFVYLMSLPVSFEELPYLYAVPTVVFISYTLAGLELIGENIEDPFGNDADDLDTDGMCETIRKNCADLLRVPQEK